MSYDEFAALPEEEATSAAIRRQAGYGDDRAPAAETVAESWTAEERARVAADLLADPQVAEALTGSGALPAAVGTEPEQDDERDDEPGPAEPSTAEPPAAESEADRARRVERERAENVRKVADKLLSRLDATLAGDLLGRRLAFLTDNLAALPPGYADRLARALTKLGARADVWEGRTRAASVHDIAA